MPYPMRIRTRQTGETFGGSCECLSWEEHLSGCRTAALPELELSASHPCGYCAEGEAAGAAGLCLSCDRAADELERAS